MKRSIYFKLTCNGIGKNRKTYFPYILTCIGMVMMFYIISFLSQNRELREMPGGASTQMMLSMGTVVIGIFALIFLFYTNSFLIRRRKKEFGLYNILGMGKRNIARILIWETILIYGISMVCGLFCGALFSKLAELCLTNILGGDIVFTVLIEWSSIKLAVKVFAAIFILILCSALYQLYRSNPVELLHSDVVGEKPPKVKWISALLGLIALVGAYWYAVSIEQPLMAMTGFMFAAILVIIGTYGLFVTGSVALCYLLKKNKTYYYKTNHFVSISSMAYRMKRNGAGLASICILLTMVLVMVSSTVCLYLGAEDTVRTQYPRNICVYTGTAADEDREKVHQTVNNVLQEQQLEPENIVNYRYLYLAGYQEDNQISFDKDLNQMTNDQEYDGLREIRLIPLEDYNRMTGKQETLDSNEILLYSNSGKYAYDTITLSGYDTMQVKQQLNEEIADYINTRNIVSMLILIVPDTETLQAVDQLHANIYGADRSAPSDFYAFDLNCSEEQQITVTNQIRTKIQEFISATPGFPETQCDGAAEIREEFYAMYGSLFFLGILLGIVFIFAAVLIMYYKQISEGYEDVNRFDIMQRVGMTRKEIKKSINSQVLTVFFLPLLTAGVHITFAFFPMSRLLRLFGLFDTQLLITITVLCYLVFAILYILVYFITSKSYFNIVSNK